MSVLTKQEKMDMVSNAIDAGFTVELKTYQVETMETVDEKLSIFPGMAVKFHGHKESQSAWVSVNRDREFEDNFSMIIFLK
jgi:hypothetical protein